MDSCTDNYSEYVKKVTPKHNVMLNVFRAFVSGGAVCTFAQVIINVLMGQGIKKEDALLYETIILVGISVVLTALNIFPSIAKWAGAGVLVPITGFANGVCSSAMEYSAEGQVFGTGCQIFRIAGPVILYGIFTSWFLGLIYYVMGVLGIL